MTFKGQEEKEPGRSSQRGSQGIISTWYRGRGERRAVRDERCTHQSFPSCGRGQAAAQTPQAFGAGWCLLLSLFPTLWEEERRKQRRKRRPICLPAVGQTPTLKGSPPTPLPLCLSCRKFQGALGGTPRKCEGPTILLWGHFGIAGLMVLLVSTPHLTASVLSTGSCLYYTGIPST